MALTIRQRGGRGRRGEERGRGFKFYIEREKERVYNDTNYKNKIKIYRNNMREVYVDKRLVYVVIIYLT